MADIGVDGDEYTAESVKSARALDVIRGVGRLVLSTRSLPTDGRESGVSVFLRASKFILLFDMALGCGAKSTTSDCFGTSTRDGG